MRRVLIVDGIKQRIPEILGQQLDGGSEGDVTSWSIQAAILSNLNRIVSALSGNSTCGRILKGLEIERSGANSIRISKGYGITANGGIISVCHQSGSSIEVAIPSSPSSATYYIHLVHRIIKLDDDAYSGRKSTSVINEAESVDIAYDEQAMAQGSAVAVNDVVVYNTTGIITDNNDLVYVGSVGVTGGVIPSPATITPSAFRGLSPNLVSGQDVINLLEVTTALHVSGYARIETDLEVGEELSVGAKADFGDDIECTLAGTGLIMTNPSSPSQRVRVRVNAAGDGLEYDVIT